MKITKEEKDKDKALEYVNGKLNFAENNNRKITKSYKDERN